MQGVRAKVVNAAHKTDADGVEKGSSRDKRDK